MVLRRASFRKIRCLDQQLCDSPNEELRIERCFHDTAISQLTPHQVATEALTCELSKELEGSGAAQWQRRSIPNCLGLDFRFLAATAPKPTHCKEPRPEQG